MFSIHQEKINEGISLLLNLKIADIACGTGSFLTEVLFKLNEIRLELINKFGENVFKNCRGA